MPRPSRPIRYCWLAMMLVVAGVALMQPAQGFAADHSALAKTMLTSLGDQAGLCVHLGVRNVALTSELSGGGKFLVHGLTRDRESIEQARKEIRSQGLAGVVSIEHDSLRQLPYSDNLVNLLVAEDLSGSLDKDKLLDEVLRVLRPGGVAFVSKLATVEKQLSEYADKGAVAGFGTKEIDGSQWLSFRKPRPKAMDEWTHRRYDATRNAVSRDKVDIPTGVRWVAGPNWPTGNRKASVPGVVASKDRLVYVFDDLVETDDGPQHRNTLIARDAYNGMLLWRRATSLQSPPVLVHVGGRVYNVVKDDGPLVALDARSGEVVQTYPEAGSPKELFFVDGQLLARTRSDIRCLAADTGDLLWRFEGASDVVAGDGRVFLQTGFRSEKGERLHGVVCVDLTSGKELWRSSTKSWPTKPSSLEMILYQDGILVFGGQGNHAISAQDGLHLWTYNYQLIGHGGSYVKVVHMNDLVWVHNAASIGPEGKSSYAWEGLNPKSGKVAKRLAHGGIKHRCMYDVATERYFLCGSMDFVDVVTEEHTRFAAARNSCRTAGVVPANGLVYTFPHACACYPLLRGFLGLASKDGGPTPTSDDRYQTGPAFETEFASQQESKTAWTTYRGDPHRSGSTATPGPAQLRRLWERTLTDPDAAFNRKEWDQKDGGRLTSPVVADGMVLVAASDTHELSALDAETGASRWGFTAGGRIDCPPTVYRGLCLFGARDGCVYCLRARDGELVWRFRAAPDNRRIVAYGQLESRWPVVGGVLVHDKLAYFAVGRHGAADGGVHVYAAEPASGKVVWHSNPEGYGTLPDLLVAGDDEIHMADWEFDAKTGEPSSSTAREYLRASRLGLLNNAWYKRPIALRKNLQQWSIGQASGQMLAFNKEWICGFTGPSTVNGGDGQISGDCQLFAKSLVSGRGWSTKMPLGTQIKSMVLADKTLFVAGRLVGFDTASNAVRALAINDGKELAELPVAGPVVHECLSVAGGRAYLSLHSGKVICLGAN